MPRGHPRRRGPVDPGDAALKAWLGGRFPTCADRGYHARRKQQVSRGLWGSHGGFLLDFDLDIEKHLPLRGLRRLA
jgi:hypothetical protein